MIFFKKYYTYLLFIILLTPFVNISAMGKINGQEAYQDTKEGREILEHWATTKMRRQHSSMLSRSRVKKKLSRKQKRNIQKRREEDALYRKNRRSIEKIYFYLSLMYNADGIHPIETEEYKYLENPKILFNELERLTNPDEN